MTSYNEIGKRSFNSKWKIYLFSKVIKKKSAEINLNDFVRYEILDEEVELYANKYWQEFETYKIKGIEISEIEKQISDYESANVDQIKELKTFYNKNEFPKIFTLNDFNKLNEAEKCHYCGITRNQINSLGKNGKLRKKNLRGWSFEIDRKLPNLEYFKENCVMSCYWCNNAKTDEFTDKEFKEIGIQIGKVLSQRLNEI